MHHTKMQACTHCMCRSKSRSSDHLPSLIVMHEGRARSEPERRKHLHVLAPFIVGGGQELVPIEDRVCAGHEAERLHPGEGQNGLGAGSRSQQVHQGRCCIAIDWHHAA